jgi:hypothetical protein
VAGYYSATRQQNAAAPLADFCTAAYTPLMSDRFRGIRNPPKTEEKR